MRNKRELEKSVQAAGVGSGTGFFCRIEGLILSDAGEKNCVLLFLQRFLLWQYKDKDPHMPPLHLHPVAVMGSGRYSQ